MPYGIDYPEQIYALSSQPARSYFSDILKSDPEAHARRQSRALQAETEIFLRLSCSTFLAVGHSVLGISAPSYSWRSGGPSDKGFVANERSSRSGVFDIFAEI